MVHEDLLKEALEFGATNASFVEAADIVLFKKTRRIEPAMYMERLEEERDDGNQ